MNYQTSANYKRSFKLQAEADRILKSGKECRPSAAQPAQKDAKTFMVTPAWIRANATPAGGYKSDQLKLIGIRYPLLSGWMGNAYGRSISEADRIKFESYHTGYKATKKSKAVLAQGATPAKDSGAYGVTTSEPVASCGCNLQPWEDCEHSDALADAAMREMLGNDYEVEQLPPGE